MTTKNYVQVYLLKAFVNFEIWGFLSFICHNIRLESPLKRLPTKNYLLKT